MRGGGKRRSNGGSSGKNKSRSPGQNTRTNLNSGEGSSSGGGRRRGRTNNILFVEGGNLSGKGTDYTKCSASMSGPRKCSGRNYGYQYPSIEEVLDLEGDKTPSSLKGIKVDSDYEYEQSFVLGDDECHKGLGFCDALGDQNVSSPLGEEEAVDTVEESGEEEDVTPDDVMKTSKRNSGFISIGGMKLYTEDISDEDGSTESSESESSEFDSDSEIDDDMAKDYLESTGGSENMLDVNWLAEQSLDKLVLSSDKKTGKLSAIALQKASMEYGSKNPFTGYHSKAIDDLMFVKDPRSLSGKKKKKHVAKFLPQSWPSGTQQRSNKHSRSFPGEKKKHRKEDIAVKHRERMLNRGVDLTDINSILEKIVIDKVDMHCFQRMHNRDCSQVRRLADVYRLSSSCSGSGKKSFVTVSRTYQTCLPSVSDKARIKRLIGVGDDEDYYIDVSRGKKVKESVKKRVVIREERKKSSYADQPVSFVSSGVIGSEIALVKTETTLGTSSGVGVGSFEVHTRGFGSKMMAKMGFVEGGGLGKDGKGIAQPIEAIQRPKSLGLGLDFSTETEDSSPSRNKSSSSGKHVKHVSQEIGCSSLGRIRDKRLGAFEQHTTGFGSKMMARMGFVEGSGLGRGSQGIVNPLVAVRRPRARGLGAESYRVNC